MLGERARARQAVPGGVPQLCGPGGAGDFAGLPGLGPARHNSLRDLLIAPFKQMPEVSSRCALRALRLQTEHRSRPRNRRGRVGDGAKGAACLTRNGVRECVGVRQNGYMQTLSKLIDVESTSIHKMPPVASCGHGWSLFLLYIFR